MEAEALAEAHIETLEAWYQQLFEEFERKLEQKYAQFQ